MLSRNFIGQSAALALRGPALGAGRQIDHALANVRPWTR